MSAHRDALFFFEEIDRKKGLRKKPKVTCPSCGETYPAKYNKCPYCGASK
ncbi:MAG: hypothetical protein ACKD6O_08240 [Candidatus Bathyarchaeota archaeon]